MSSSIGPSGSALLALLNAAVLTSASPLYQVQVAFGGPDDFMEQELVCLTGVSTLDEISVVLGPQPNSRDESYRLDVTIRDEKPEGSAEDAWTRGWAMYDGVRGIVLNNTSLSGTVRTAFPLPLDLAWGRCQSKDGEDMPGWVVRIDMGVVCKSRG